MFCNVYFMHIVIDNFLRINASRDLPINNEQFSDRCSLDNGNAKVFIQSECHRTT